MTKKELNQWYDLHKQIVNGYHLSKDDWQDLIRLNHLVMETSHAIHNKNMLEMKHA